jgi:uncharacterized 2Fe-2S/4Fe-4S cluster protein (DUF4445 family)
LVGQIEKIETGLEDKFQQYFVKAMAFPHKTDTFANLFSVVERQLVITLRQEANTGGRRRPHKDRVNGRWRCWSDESR